MKNDNSLEVITRIWVIIRRLFEISAIYILDNRDSLGLCCRRLRLESLEAIVKYVSTFLLVHWNTAREIPAIAVSMEY
jgi:hypothetical protein